MSDAVVLPGLVSFMCLLRGLPLFICATPKTPLRALCVIAFSTIRRLRGSRPLPPDRIRALAAFLDFGACTNAALDRKRFCPHESHAMRQRLERAHFGPFVDDYLRQLQELEGRRPAPGGGKRRYKQIRAYRESVVRLSLATVAIIALGEESPAVRIEPIAWDQDLEALFRIVMQCQIIDDVLDYTEDASAGLPSFLTACASLPRAMELTAQSSRDYSTYRGRGASAAAFPLRFALVCVSALTKLVVQCGHKWQQRRSSSSTCPPRSADAIEGIALAKFAGQDCGHG